MLDALLILDWNGVILFANQAAAELVELDTTEAGIGRNTVEFIHPDFLETVFVDLINSMCRPAAAISSMFSPLTGISLPFICSMSAGMASRRPWSGSPYLSFCSPTVVDFALLTDSSRFRLIHD